MPLPVPRLDDRTFEQLVQEGRSLIPRYSPTWTNHNPSDPGITLLEELAYLTESAIFQLDQIPDAAIESFLALVGVCRQRTAVGAEPIELAVADALDALDLQEHAITSADLEQSAADVTLFDRPRVLRAEVAIGEDLLCADDEPPFVGPPSYVVVTVVADRRLKQSAARAFEAHVFRLLKERALLATRLHVVVAERVKIRIAAVVARKPGSGLSQSVVEREIARFLDPLVGGPEGKGWPFGRWVYRSELFQLLEATPQVDHVDSLTVSALPADLAASVRLAGVDHAEGVEVPPSALVYDPVELEVRVTDARD